MNHPEESIINARLYHTRKIQEAEARRQAKTFLGTNTSIWSKVASKLQSLKAQSEKTYAEEPTLLESAH